MAASLVSARSFKEIENHLVCDVCTKTINEPKKLPCSHSFCKACLENLATQAKDNADGEGKTLHCPTCRSKTTLKPGENVAGLPDDKSVLKLLTAVGPNRDQEASVCSMCEKKPSFAICIECSGKELLCDSCVVDHDRWPTNEPHTILSISDVVNRDQHKECGAEQLSCTLHKDTIPSFYCETCKELICMRKCATSHHKKPGHTFVAVHEIYRKQQDAVKTKCATINAMLLEGNKALEIVTTDKATYEETAKDIKVKHTAQKDEMIKAVVDRTEAVTDGMNEMWADKIQEVDNAYDSACQKLSVQAETISNYVQKVEKSLQRTNDVLKNSKLKELFSAQKVIDDDIQTLRNERPQNLTTFKAQVENPQSCAKKPCFYTVFEKLTEGENQEELTEYLNGWARNALGKKLVSKDAFVAETPDQGDFTNILNRWTEYKLGKKLDQGGLTEYLDGWARNALGKELVSLPTMPDSVILKNEKQLYEHLFTFVKKRIWQLRLCYRASLHGWSAQQFHQRCDYKAETVVLVKVGNWIFGGYTDQTWQGSGQWKSSNASFLFSLRNPNNMQPFKCPIINGKNGNAINCNPSYGAIFGGGRDLAISGNANSNTNSYSDLGNTYQAPPGYQCNTQQTQSLFAGSRNFKPNEVEVFY